MSRPARTRLAVLAACSLSLPLATTSQAADAAPTRLYLHSASGSYATDSRGTVPWSAPVGSFLSADRPSRPSSASSATADGGNFTKVVPGGPTTPTWSVPISGAVNSVCADLFLEATALTPLPPSPEVYYVLRLHSGGPNALAESKPNTVDALGPGVVRLTFWVKTSSPYEVTPSSLFVVHGLEAGTTAILRSFPEWRLHYDSAEHFSSVTFNTTKEKCTPAELRAPAR